MSPRHAINGSTLRNTPTSGVDQAKLRPRCEYPLKSFYRLCPLPSHSIATRPQGLATGRLLFSFGCSSQNESTIPTGRSDIRWTQMTTGSCAIPSPIFLSKSQKRFRRPLRKSWKRSSPIQRVSGKAVTDEIINKIQRTTQAEPLLIKRLIDAGQDGEQDQEALLDQGVKL